MEISQLPGLGPKRAEALRKAGLGSVADLLYNIPRTYLDHTKVTPIGQCRAGDKVVLIGTIKRAGIVRGRRSRFMATLTDGTGEIQLLFFQGTSYWARRIKNDTRWCVSGAVGEYRGLQMTHPDMQPFDDDEEFTGAILPVYPISEACREARMEQKFFRKLYKTIFGFPGLTLPGLCPRVLTDYLRFAPVMQNLRTLHLPKEFPAIYKAKRELKVLELLPFCLRMVKRRENQKLRGHERQIDLGTVMAAKASLPFTLTRGQEEALNTIVAGLNGKKQFHALLQGDVGCGKTVVAMLAMMAVCGGGSVASSDMPAGNGMREQCALMVPTDILARQHYKSLKPFFDAAGLNVRLLVGATPAAEKKVILGEIQMGLADIVIGTHALFSKDVIFSRLGFVVIDEQHRFGVGQREALLAKGDYPDMLVMSATPIPRSLAMTLYGDLKVISIKEKPAGRKPIKTRLVNASKREDMKKFICKEAATGNLCYWIASRVGSDDEGGARSVDEIVEELRSYVAGPGAVLNSATSGSTAALNGAALKVAGVHGQMDENERDAIIAQFAAGKIHILVATTVIEVGVNVPAANLMVIDQPDRFGLAQLHQLRGRVGRGDREAWCFLMIPEGDTADTSMERLSQFSQTEDGFEIAELDLQTRGAGNLEGYEQSGAWVFRWFDWIADQELISQTLETAEHILHDKESFDDTAREQIQAWYGEKEFTNEDGVH
ncbi:ATP-dependent DNA helicase RecG [Fibrobacter sp. UWT3]|uniref:ATP-dependent DNA helicase RecG n=1 Tax=Fibrobacter sp. UWT3 TaxID=1896225 RepID=UPI000BCC7972|nr:ATP-dependent DNA helicase RecG [Fibrobacter sp. UWT3]SOE54465.1 ATP-dependent DNA helicase RecG [Fibrobacter sp. UWT3]